MNDALLDWTLFPLSAIHMKIVRPLAPHASVLTAVAKLDEMIRAITPFGLSLLLGAAGPIASIYVACRRQPTPRATWFCGYTLGCTGLLMIFGFGVRCVAGDRAVLGEDHALSAHFIFWPVTFLALGGCHAGLLRRENLSFPFQTEK